MDPDGHAGLADPLGDADVVAVRVGEQQRVDVRDRPAAFPQERLELFMERGQAGVHEREPAVRLDEVEVDELVAQPVDPGRDLGGHGHNVTGFESRWTPGRSSGTVPGPMASRLYLSVKPMPAAAGHMWVEARPFAILTSNDQPRGT